MSLAPVWVLYDTRLGANVTHVGTTKQARRTVGHAIELANQTPQGVATQAGISRETMRRRLTNEDNFTIGELRSIATVLGTTICELIPEATEFAHAGGRS